MTDMNALLRAARRHGTPVAPPGSVTFSRTDNENTPEQGSTEHVETDMNALLRARRRHTVSDHEDTEGASHDATE
jgi:hypothetical protein